MIGLISNRRDVPDRFETEIAEAAERALKAGASPQFEYIGMGMTGIVFCDDDRAYKVARTKKSPRVIQLLAEEAEWLATASNIPEVRKHVAVLIDWDRKHGVIVRECVRGRSGTWGASTKVNKIFDDVSPFMLAAGWTMPELKEDSVVFDASGAGKIVDASLPSRISNRLLQYIESVLNGRRPIRDIETMNDFAFYVRREFGQSGPPMDDARAKRLLSRLYDLGARP